MKLHQIQMAGVASLDTPPEVKIDQAGDIVIEANVRYAGVTLPAWARSSNKPQRGDLSGHVRLIISLADLLAAHGLAFKAMRNGTAKARVGDGAVVAMLTSRSAQLHLLDDDDAAAAVQAVTGCSDSQIKSAQRRVDVEG